MQQSHLYKDVLLIYSTSMTALFDKLPQGISTCQVQETNGTNLPDAYTYYSLILVFNGNCSFDDQVQDFILRKHAQGTPIILFPYTNSTNLLLEQLQILHPCKHGNETSVRDDITNANSTLVKIIPHHPVLQNVQSFECPSMFRVAAPAKPDTIVIATWLDDVPLVAERGNVLHCNFCLTNSNANTHVTLLVHQAISYMLKKNTRMLLLERLKSTRAYCDVVVMVL